MASTRKNKKFSEEMLFVPESHFESCSWIKFPCARLPGNHLKTQAKLARRIVQIAQIAPASLGSCKNSELESKSRSVGRRGDGYIGCKI